MTLTQFHHMIAATHLRDGKTAKACRLVLVDGLSAYRAARISDVDQSAVIRALRKIPREACKACGQPILPKS